MDTATVEACGEIRRDKCAHPSITEPQKRLCQALPHGRILHSSSSQTAYRLRALSLNLPNNLRLLGREFRRQLVHEILHDCRELCTEESREAFTYCLEGGPDGLDEISPY